MPALATAYEYRSIPEPRADFAVFSETVVIPAADLLESATPHKDRVPAQLEETGVSVPVQARAEPDAVLQALARREPATPVVDQVNR
jgi:hypothetical protein